MSAAAATVAAGTHILSKSSLYNRKIETVAKVECNLTFGEPLSGCGGRHPWLDLNKGAHVSDTGCDKQVRERKS